MSGEDPRAQYKYTQVAAKAVSLAELFEARFDQGVEGPVRFKVELSAPDGPSTAGGKLAMQHIKLVPVAGGPTIVVGSADTTKQLAEIRTYEHIAALYAQRFKGAKIPVDVTRYQDLAQGLATFFRGMKMNVSFAELDGATAASPVRNSLAGGSSGSRAGAILVGLGVGLTVLAAAFWFIFMRH